MQTQIFTPDLIEVESKGVTANIIRNALTQEVKVFFTKGIVLNYDCKVGIPFDVVLATDADLILEVAEQIKKM